MQAPALERATASSSASSSSSASGPTTYTLRFSNPAIQPRTDYMVALLAVDLAGNVQQQYTWVLASTEDNEPPAWLSSSASAAATTANVTLRISEVGTVYWYARSGSASCPSADTVSAPLQLPTSCFCSLAPCMLPMEWRCRHAVLPQPSAM